MQTELLYRQVLKIFERHLGAEHPAITAEPYGLAAVLHQQGHYAQAEPLYRRALKIQERQLGRRIHISRRSSGTTPIICVASAATPRPQPWNRATSRQHNG